MKTTYSLALLSSVLASSTAFAADGPPSHALTIDIGAGTFLAPAFLGSKDYQLVAAPMIGLKYKDIFFASLGDGVGFNIINTNGFRAGPIAKYVFERTADGNNALRIAGKETDALRGLGKVDGTFELGGFAEYKFGNLTPRIELRKGVNGHDGVISDVKIDYTQDLQSIFHRDGLPAFLTIGPHATLVNRQYNSAYFGVDAGQSSASGLPKYKASGGLLSYGIEAAAILPVTETISTGVVAGYDRLTGSAADSPLVRQKGAENQFSAGLFLSYELGY